MQVAVLMLATAALRVVFLAGPIGSDDTRYMDAAWKLAHGQPPGVFDIAYVRAAFVLWLAAWTRVGLAGTKLLVVQVMVNLLLVGALYWTIRRLTADARAAFLGALCWALFPVELVSAGAVVPDQLAALLALLAGGAAITALRAPPGKGRLALVSAGVLSGVAVSVKEPNALLPIIFGLWAWWEIRPIRAAAERVVVIGLIALCTFALEYPFFRIWTGDWLYRHEALSQVYGPGGALAAQRHVYWGTFVYYLRGVLLNPAIAGMFGWLLLIAALRAPRHVREAKFIGVWSLCFFVFLQFGSTTLKQYQPLPMQARYVAPMIIWLFVPLGRWLADLTVSAPVGPLGVAVLLGGVSLQGVMAVEARAADGIGFAGLPRSVERTLAMRAEGVIGAVALPDTVERRLPPDLRQQTVDWPKINLAAGITDAELCRFREQGIALLLPLDLAKLPSVADEYGPLATWLDARARNLAVADGLTFIDRFLLRSRIATLQRRATTVTIANIYVFDRASLAHSSATSVRGSATADGSKACGSSQ